MRTLLTKTSREAVGMNLPKPGQKADRAAFGSYKHKPRVRAVFTVGAFIVKSQKDKAVSPIRGCES